MADNKEKSPIKWIAWAASLLMITGAIFFIVALTAREKGALNTQTSQHQAPVRQMSGTFIVPAGKGPEETKIWINLKEIVWLAAEPETKLLDAKNGRVINVYSNGWISLPTKKRGHLIFIKGQVPVNVKYKIIN